MTLFVGPGRYSGDANGSHWTRLAESDMWTGEAMDEAANACLGARCSGARESLILVILMYGLTLSTAPAAEQGADVVKNMQPMVGGTPIPRAFLPDHWAVGDEPASGFETAMDSRRRSTGIGSRVYETEASVQSRPLQVNPPWQHLSDYRSQGRVQVLTLWASPSNMVSLQAGKHGSPTLQWSSRVMNRGGATRGVLDRFVASSLGAARADSKIAHSSAAAPASKTVSSMPASRSP